ncbi:MFS transporter [Spirochaetota bacterium]
MLSRFSLYGFTKNMRFFEPFLILFYLKLGLSFFQIGILISFQTICINIMEIPSGAIADIYGRKNSITFSLACYIISFIIFFFSMTYLLLFVAVFFFSVGDAFRTGTHKAMIFDWVRRNNMVDEKTRIYGHTRSWSKFGSALSVIISSVIVIYLRDYKWVFLFSVVPYIIGIWNIYCYPAYLNKSNKDAHVSIKMVIDHLFESIKSVIGSKGLRRLIIQNMGFEGVFRVTKDYLQPILKSEASLLALILLFPEERVIALIVGAVYFVINISSGFAAKNSYKIVNKIKSEESASVLFLFLSFLVVIASALSLYFYFYKLTIVILLIYFMFQNIWRPILISQYDNFTDHDKHATILSIESQTKNVGVFILAPVAGYLADLAGIHFSFALLSFILLCLGIYSFFSRDSLVKN